MDILFFTGLLVSLLYLAVSILSGVGFFAGRRFAAVAGNVLVVVGALLHLTNLALLGILESKIPFTTFFEAMSVISLFVVLIYLILRLSLTVQSLSFFVFPLAFAFQTISVFGPRAMYLGEEFTRSPLFWFHTLSTLAGYAAFGYSMIVGLMHLHLFRELKSRRLKLMYDRLPPLELLDRMNGVALTGGFVFLTVGIVLGSTLALTAWGHLPILDPKVFLSLLLWLIYVFGIVALRLLRWSGKRMSWLSVVGFLALIVIMVVVRIVEGTFHRF